MHRANVSLASKPKLGHKKWAATWTRPAEMQSKPQTGKTWATTTKTTTDNNNHGCLSLDSCTINTTPNLRARQPANPPKHREALQAHQRLGFVFFFFRLYFESRLDQQPFNCHSNVNPFRVHRLIFCDISTLKTFWKKINNNKHVDLVDARGCGDSIRAKICAQIETLWPEPKKSEVPH